MQTPSQAAPPRKGIILAGGRGSRLYPLTRVVCKQLLPVYDKPLVYYPLSTLMLAGIREILVISTPEDRTRFEDLLGDGAHLGLSLDYAVQPQPQGIAQAFLIGENFIGGGGVTLILGDNIFHGPLGFLRRALHQPSGATIFGCHVRDPERFGVVEFDAGGRVIGIEEKPAKPRSSFAVPGLYVYDNRVVDLCRGLRPSARGELEITDLNRAYLARGELKVEILGRGIAWLDTGTPASLLEAGAYIATLERQQNLKVACLEEVAFNQGYIDREGLEALINRTPNPAYADYLRLVMSESPY